MRQSSRVFSSLSGGVCLLAAALAACAPAPPYAHLPDPGEGSAHTGVQRPVSNAVSTTRGTGTGTGGGACGRLLAVHAYQARLRDLIAAIEADGVTAAERTDLMRAYSRLYEAEAAEAAASRDVSAARYKLEALTGGDLRAAQLPACE